MKILHLFSDWKWTGPAEPALNLAEAQARAGHDTRFVCGAPPPEAEQSLSEMARRRGFPVDTSLRMSKHRNPLANFFDGRALVRMIREERFTIVHAHRQNDHFVGGRAARSATEGVRVVRTLYDGEIPGDRRWRLLCSRYTDGLITPSRSVADEMKTAVQFPNLAVAHVPGAVDVRRFHPGVDGRGIRAELGLGPEHLVAGVVARMQHHRRFEILLPAIREAHDRIPDLRVVVFGRGTNRQVVAIDPAREMGLEEVILFPGYRDRDYVEALASIDFLIFLVPGSDGSCRAAREAMALGRPVIAARRGMLPELVTRGETGLLCNDTEEELFAAIVEMASDGERRTQMGTASARKAREEFDLDAQARRILEFYEEVSTS